MGMYLLDFPISEILDSPIVYIVFHKPVCLLYMFPAGASWFTQTKHVIKRYVNVTSNLKLLVLVTDYYLILYLPGGESYQDLNQDP